MVLIPGSHGLLSSNTTSRRKPARQKKKKRRSKRKWLAAAQALTDQQGVLCSKRRDFVSPIARPRRDLNVGQSKSRAAFVSSRVGTAFTSSEDESLARLFATKAEDVKGSVMSMSQACGEEVSSSVCVTESELSDTPWEESCDADDELSCFEAPKLHACYMSALGRCDGDVEDECETATSDQDKRLTAETRGSVSVTRRPCRRTMQAAHRHVSPGNQHMLAGAANSLTQIKCLLTQFVSGERTPDRNLRLPSMNRSTRRVVWRLATLYNLQCRAERAGRLQYLLLTRTAASRVPEAGVLEQLWQRASLSCPIPIVAPMSKSFLSGPLESEEVFEQSDVSDHVSPLPLIRNDGVGGNTC